MIRCPTPLASSLAALLLIAGPARGQEQAKPSEPAPPLAVINARVAGHARPVTIQVSGGKIRSIGPSRGAPRAPNLLVIDAEGARVVPGRIDAFASLGNPDALGRAIDAFDRYDTRTIEQALAAGVTAALLNPRRSVGVCGVASLIKLRPGVAVRDLIVVEEAAVCSSLGLGAEGPAARAEHAVALRKQLEGARTYRDAWLDYDDALAEYVKELEESAKKDEGKEKGKGAYVEDADAFAPRPRGRRRPTPRRPAAKDAKKGDAKQDGPKKPKRPPVDRTKALLVRVLERELPLRIEAHRVEDIANALELQREFGFRLILEGATEAHRLAEVLAEREVPVVFGPLLRSTLGGGFYPPEYRPDTPALLREAGVTVAIGSDTWEAIPTLPANAAAACAGPGKTLDPAEVEATLTTGAAEVCGVSDRLGRIAVGYDADLVVLEELGLGAERAKVVVVDGVIAFQRGTP